MSDLISKRELYKKLGEAYNQGCLTWGANEVVKDIIGECHPVENKGTWRHYEGMLYCPKCGAEFYDEIMEYTGDEVPKHCPECGADMRGET